MANPNPWQARAARQDQAQAAASSDLEQALEVLRLCLTRNQAILQRPETPDESIFRASHAVSQVANAVAKLVDAIELQSRIQAIEDKISYASKPVLIKGGAKA